MSNVDVDKRLTFFDHLPTYLNVDNLYPKGRQKWSLFGPPTNLIWSTT